MFQTQARTKRYYATRALNACKMAKGTSVSAHDIKMKRHIDHLERLGHPVPLQLATDTILNSLSDDYKQFVINYNMNNMEKTIAELHSMLKTAELSMGTKTKDVLMVKEGGVKKKCGHRNTSKGKDQVQSVPKAVDNGKRKGKGKGKKVKVNRAKTENRCFRCHEVGHWRQNCPKRHETGKRLTTGIKMKESLVRGLTKTQHFKARLVAKGFTQTHGIDYDEIFSPVAMLKSIRILMAISAYFNYIDKILKKFRMDKSKKGFIPMQHDIVLSKTQCPVSSQDQDKMKSVPYASAIGSIMYAMLCTRPDVAYSVSVTSRYQQNPGEPHWVAVKNILKYLRRTKDMFLVFGGSEDEISVTGYSDASFQTDRDDFRSHSGYARSHGRARSKTQLQIQLQKQISLDRFILFCDNSGAVAQAKEPREHHKSRHVLRKYHIIREIIGRGDVRICKIPTDDNVADPLTKPLARVKHEAHACSIGMQYLDASR
ncbi:LOW QUALITY PROTEIN: hypothetical protein OSB04_027853 [Centaurea solstitialis]|uniref:CCHC-type domain-containing protein n=1 Tax=Centaurea solstitialis TaxID=347529 RepID=A0AA38SY56_9ASTR|nr:LOW QUALITY PROTEIN: hypothetical protein OSB04_027853 [Centaurea solstitialis]